MRLTVIGSVALDTIETPYGKREDVLGGSASYASLSAAFFAPVSLISVVGTDFPKKYLAAFRKRDIDVTGVETKRGGTFRWNARYSADLGHAQTLSTSLNVFTGFKPAIPPGINPKDSLLLANIDPELQDRIFRSLRPRGVVACDTMNLWIEREKKALTRLLKKVDLFLLNDAEARQFSGEQNLMDAARHIASKGARMVVIKKGEHGAMLFSAGVSFVVPAYPLQTVKDPTGAGDTFAGGMMGYLSRRSRITDRDLRRSLVYGSILASFAVESFSVDGLLKACLEKVDGRYRRFRDLTRF